MTSTKRTALYDFHVKHGAKMVPFAGYEMPVQYPLGVLEEHLHCRKAAGLFDVSHMGQIRISGENAAEALEALVPVDVVGLAEGRQRYAMFTNSAGGIEDDLMIANRGDHFLLVVNAARKEHDLGLLRDGIDGCEIEMLEDRGLLALQGPSAEAVLAEFTPQVADMAFMDVIEAHVLGVDCIISRSGYTGEDGFEISMPSDGLEPVAAALLDMDAVALIGLGARDSLRLEAGLCLYGSDIDAHSSPIEAGLVWAIQKSRRPGGAREGGFAGADEIFRDLKDGAPRKRVGLLPEGRAPMRADTPLYADVSSDKIIGVITSGGFGPSVGAPVSMAYVHRDAAKSGAIIFGDVRGKRLPARITDMPFVPHNFKR
jgi:aminomethyltransferase